jgi:hypothetical protein
VTRAVLPSKEKNAGNEFAIVSLLSGRGKF